MIGFASSICLDRGLHIPGRGILYVQTRHYLCPGGGTEPAAPICALAGNQTTTFQILDNTPTTEPLWPGQICIFFYCLLHPLNACRCFSTFLYILNIISILISLFVNSVIYVLIFNTIDLFLSSLRAMYAW